MVTDYCNLHALLIEAAGGTIALDSGGSKRFVTRAGVMLPFGPRHFNPDFLQVLETLRVDLDASVSTCFAEFLARLTYLSCGPKDIRNGESFVRKIALDLGHAGITGLESEPVLFAGVSDEIVKELLSHEHGEVVPARVGRLTSANTAAMEETLYVVSPYAEFQAREMAFIEVFRQWSEEFRLQYPQPQSKPTYLKEHNGRLNLGIKATSVTIAMSSMHWKWLFMGRLKADGNEDELRRIVARACSLLHERYPVAIGHPSSYGYTLEDL